MYSIVTEYRTDLAMHRTWCKLKCGHEVLTNMAPWVGSPIDCLKCSVRTFQSLRPGECYALFFLVDPSTPILFHFHGFKWGLSSGHFEDSHGKRQHIYATEVVAIEVL